jgi:hypothetical protein
MPAPLYAGYEPEEPDPLSVINDYVYRHLSSNERCAFALGQPPHQAAGSEFLESSRRRFLINLAALDLHKRLSFCLRFDALLGS